MNGYSVSIAETNKELSAKERIRLKDTSDAVKLNETTKEEAIIITPTAYAILNIHNEKSDNKDYNNYLIYRIGAKLTDITERVEHDVVERHNNGKLNKRRQTARERVVALLLIQRLNFLLNPLF